MEDGSKRHAGIFIVSFIVVKMTELISVWKKTKNENRLLFFDIQHNSRRRFVGGFFQKRDGIQRARALQMECSPAAFRSLQAAKVRGRADVERDIGAGTEPVAGGGTRGPGNKSLCVSLPGVRAVKDVPRGGGRTGSGQIVLQQEPGRAVLPALRGRAVAAGEREEVVAMVHFSTRARGTHVGGGGGVSAVVRPTGDTTRRALLYHLPPLVGAGIGAGGNGEFGRGGHDIYELGGHGLSLRHA